MAELKFDVAIAGGGLAGLTAAYALAKKGVNVALLERGSYPGSKNVCGGIFYPVILKKLIPEYRSEAPIERLVSKRSFHLMAGEACFSFEFSLPTECFTVLRAKFDRWFAGKVEEAGATIICETLVEDVIRRDGRAVGVKTDRGEIASNLVIIADGAPSLLAEKLGLRKPSKPNRFVLGVKEVISLPEEEVERRFNLSREEGAALIFYGEPLTKQASGFIYTNRESLSVGVASYLHQLARLQENPNQLLEEFKRAKAVAPLVKGGTIKEYSAHLIPESYEGELYGEGVLVAGDAAGLLNSSPLFLEGTSLAMASGLTAAEVSLEALERGDYSKRFLSKYERMLNDSFVLKDVKRYRRFPEFLERYSDMLADYPRMFGEFLAQIYSADERPKEDKVKEAFARLGGKIGLLKALLFLLKLWRSTL
ncbi:FAD-dependent oxidoreductase [Candidatus Bathyarchaeota archaeon]|nr:MAG: FAD-dependent oxidoreductase [Candidatus Bathyarchaeota archaeon]